MDVSPRSPRRVRSNSRGQRLTKLSDVDVVGLTTRTTVERRADTKLLRQPSMSPDSPQFLRRQSVLGDKYFLERNLLVNSTYAKLFMAKHLEDAKLEYAIKVVDNRSSDGLYELRREATVLRRLQGLSDHIAAFVDGPLSERGQTSVVTKFVHGMSLQEHVDRYGPLSNAEIARVLRDVVEALEACYRCGGISHRDLRPENIMLDARNDNRAVLVDFGLASVAPGLTNSDCGTDLFSAPEVLSQEYYTPVTIDVWSLGVVLFYCATGRTPWPGMTFQQCVLNAVNGRFELPACITFDLADLISDMLTVNPFERPSFAAIRQHPFYQRHL